MADAQKHIGVRRAQGTLCAKLVFHGTTASTRASKPKVVTVAKPPPLRLDADAFQHAPTKPME